MTTGPATGRTAASVAVGRRHVEARARLRFLVGFSAFGAGVSGMYAVTGLGFPCPLLMLTGWQCPLCGGTRLGAALWHADIAAAFGYNPVVFVGLMIGGLLGLIWIVEALGGPAVRLPRRWRWALARVRPTQWTILAVVAGLAYTLIRNLA